MASKSWVLSGCFHCPRQWLKLRRACEKSTLVVGGFTLKMWDIIPGMKSNTIEINNPGNPVTMLSNLTCFPFLPAPHIFLGGKGYKSTVLVHFRHTRSGKHGKTLPHALGVMPFAEMFLRKWDSTCVFLLDAEGTTMNSYPAPVHDKSAIFSTYSKSLSPWIAWF